MADDSRKHPTRGWVWLILLILLFLLIVGYFLLPKPEPVTPKLSVDTYASGESFVTWFQTAHDDKGWYRSDFDNVGHFMQVGWAEDHIRFDTEGMWLQLSDRPSPTNRHTAGEYQRRGRYGFGRYEVVMRAPVGSGLVTSFFTHTGPYFGDPHDEIDFEVLGKDTKRIYLNWFSDGQEGEPRWHELGFDAAKDFHLYAFEWTPETIRWYVDNELVYERAEGALPVPQTPGRIIANLWTGSTKQYSWHGVPAFSVPVQAGYKCMSFRRLDDLDTPQCSNSWTGVKPQTDSDLAISISERE
jgi:beta-glucanase (GH16 family)